MDRRHPDGSTFMPWLRDCILIWDVYKLIFIPSHQQLAVREAGAVAAQAEQWKAGKHVVLVATHHFIPLAIEVTGVFDPQAHFPVRALPVQQRKVRRGLVVPLPTPKDRSVYPERNATAVKDTCLCSLYGLN